MEISNDEILKTIETFYLTYPAIPGKLEYFDIPGIKGWYSPNFSHPLLNLVAITNLTIKNVDRTIQVVLDQFKSQKKAFGWWVSVSSMPSDITKRLQTAGLTRIAETSGMSLDVQHPITTNPDVYVRRALSGEDSLAADLYHRAYPVPKILAEHRVELWGLMGVFQYFAFLENNPDPVAVASMWYRPGFPIALLGGAATLTEYRGHGIYTSVVAQRLKDADEDGKQIAVISADQSTSAPICQKLGFVEQCSLELYAWMPPES